MQWFLKTEIAAICKIKIILIIQEMPFFLNWQVHKGQLLPCGKLLETTAPPDFPDENLRARKGKWVVVNPLDLTYLKIAT